MTDEVKHPAWGYREGEAKIFDDGVIPKGWYDSPAKIPAKKGGKAEPEPTETTAGVPVETETEAGE